MMVGRFTPKRIGQFWLNSMQDKWKPGSLDAFIIKVSFLERITWVKPQVTVNVFQGILTETGTCLRIKSGNIKTFKKVHCRVNIIG